MSDIENNPGQSAADMAALEKKLVRKLDMRIMPILCVAYLLNYIDR